MPKIIIAYVKYVDYVTDKLGKSCMYLVLIMIAILLLNAITRNVINYPLSWCIQMAQFTMTAYYFLGGAYTLKSDDHVRMDLIYDNLSEKGKAKMDMFTSTFLMTYLICLLIGSISSAAYSIKYNQKLFSQWNPSVVPIKVIMVIGISLMILQVISLFFKDYAKVKGKPIT